MSKQLFTIYFSSSKKKMLVTSFSEQIRTSSDHCVGPDTPELIAAYIFIKTFNLTSQSLNNYLEFMIDQSVSQINQNCYHSTPKMLSTRIFVIAVVFSPRCQKNIISVRSCWRGTSDAEDGTADVLAMERWHQLCWNNIFYISRSANSRCQSVWLSCFHLWDDKDELPCRS